MTANQLQDYLIESIHSAHTLSALRTHISTLRSMLYRSNSKKLDAYLLNELPEKFSFVTKLLREAADPIQQEKLLELTEKILLSFETLYLTLPYSPTESQLGKYKQLFAAQISQPFIIKVELDPDTLGKITWEFAGARKTASVFDTLAAEGGQL